MHLLLALLFCTQALFATQEKRLTHADKVGNNQHPWLVHLRIGTLEQKFIACAIQISDRWLVTAAHVLTDGPDPICLRIRYSNTDSKNEITAEAYVSHPKYRPPLGNPENEQVCWGFNINDIALIKLSEPSPLDVYPKLDAVGFDHNRLYSRAFSARRNDKDFAIQVTLAGYGHEDNDQLYAASAVAYSGDCILSGSSPVNLYNVSYEGQVEPGDSGGALFNNSQPPLLYGIMSTLLLDLTTGAGVSVLCTVIARHRDFIQFHTGLNLTGSWIEPDSNVNQGSLVDVTCNDTGIISGIVTGALATLIFTAAIIGSVSYCSIKLGSKGASPTTQRI